ncbi:MAG: acetylglutamate kinase [Actinomycetota bacterium]
MSRTATRVDEAQAKARVLAEALPYIRRWAGKTVVVKVGGETLEEERRLELLANDLVLLRFVGMNPVVVHGGGPQISETMRRLGMEPAFRDGRRVTDAETIKVVKMVLLGEVNPRIVAAMNSSGGRAAGISGEDGRLIEVRRALGPNREDLGFVGEVERVNPSILEGLVQDDFIPVVAPVGSGPDGSYNINADLAAGAVAAAIGATKLVFLTNVPGLYRDLGDEGSLISEVTVEQCRALVESGSLSEGMIPKITSVIAALEAGVPQAHILDGRVEHALLLEIFTDEGVGTMVLP